MKRLWLRTLATLWRLWDWLTLLTLLRLAWWPLVIWWVFFGRPDAISALIKRDASLINGLTFLLCPTAAFCWIWAEVESPKIVPALLKVYRWPKAKLRQYLELHGVDPTLPFPGPRLDADERGHLSHTEETHIQKSQETRLN